MELLIVVQELFFAKQVRKPAIELEQLLCNLFPLCILGLKDFWLHLTL